MAEPSAKRQRLEEAKDPKAPASACDVATPQKVSKRGTKEAVVQNYVDLLKAQQTRVVKFPSLLSETDLQQVLSCHRAVLDSGDPAVTNPQNREHKRKRCLFLHGQSVPEQGQLLSRAPAVLRKMLRAAVSAQQEGQWGSAEPDPAGSEADKNAALSGIDVRRCSIRVVELWEYESGGGLVDDYHFDAGSIVTIVGLVNDKEEFTGGQFQTKELDGHLQTHELSKGDVICFVSHKYHSITPVSAYTQAARALSLPWPNALSMRFGEQSPGSPGSDEDESEDELLLPRALKGRVGPTKRAAFCIACIGVSACVGLLAVVLQSRGQTEMGMAAWRPPERMVEELYTFGSPGASKSILLDMSREGGCIAGLRVYARSERPGWKVNTPVYDPVSWITEQFGFRHAQMAFLELSEQNLLESDMGPCRASASDPHHDDFWWVAGHSSYEAILKHHLWAQAPTGKKPLPASYDGTGSLTLLQKAYLMVHFTFVIYAPEMQTMHMDARLWGWNLVGYAESLPYADKGGLVQFHDHAALYQHPKSLECALVFEGSDRQDLSDWVYDADIKTSQFCGFEDVHSGFRDKLLAMLRSDDYDQAIRAKLPFCSRVAATGHSMGGAQAELFTACANRRIPKLWQTDALSDHELVAFQLTGPELLRPFLTEQVPGMVLRNVNNRCLGVEGPMETASGSALAAERCHPPGPRAAQRWRLGEAGSIVNEATSKCLTVDVDDVSKPATLHLCRHLADGAPHSNQTWVHTPEGLLEQRSVGNCLNAKLLLEKCAFSDQRWEPSADGRLLHKLSGRCLDVSGEAAVDGATFVLNDCAEGVEDAKLQRWGISQHGILQSLSDVSVSETLGLQR
eukprot:s4008_g4.t2